MILSGVMMLEHLGWNEAATLDRDAASSARSPPKTVTYDLERQMHGREAAQAAPSSADAIIANMSG